ncbi:Hypothetical protein NCDO2118_1354 [Lactococcus lactis subsp. lactis NCDO 2118]|uniref:ClbS/DfsB family four-helix bundle protein n=1 Tax=Lactococcus lactis subsp. lactis NCDO 2118 TaxID=1117941 RepID=A0ABC8A624_LACLL|nr:ClbS/DfsB family four-helix bundle protein [Lactococcus lactis]ADA65062.1 Hypothetical protein LLKF_1391 [Lactococcus lactis subsp. lactis KF147]AII12832.1 Hypothetical protein NCDO2118_1354 [Lactococcus lactis subsp. lactis NCDO 2118]
MARAQSKEELITFSEESWQKLCSLINSLNEETKNANFTFNIEDKKEEHGARDKNLRDVMVHLYEWHQLLINFVKKNKRGEKTPFLPSPYNWKNYGEMNDNFQINGQKKSLSEITQQLSESHMELITLIENFSNKELFTKKYFDWTGSTSLGQYFQSSMSSHYEWAYKKIKLHKKTSEL